MATYYWVGGSGTWDNASTTNWAIISGGAGGLGVPNNADTAIFDANSGTAATVTVAATAVSLSTTVNKADINLSLSGSPTLCTSVGTLTFTAGTITLNSFTLSCGIFSSSNSNTRAIAFGTGKINLTFSIGALVWGCATLTGFTLTGTPNVESPNGTAGTRTFQHGSAAGGTEANAINLKISGGSDTVNNANASVFKNLDFTGFAGTWAGGLNSRTIYGNLTLSSTMTVTAGNNAITFAATSGTQQITTAGKTLDFPIIQNSPSATFQLQDNFTIGSTRTFLLTSGTLDANNNNVSIGSFSLGAGTKTLTLGSGTWTITGANWNANANVANLTVSASTGIISMTSASTKTFSGGAKAWPTLNQGGSGALIIEQSNTFANITDTVQPATVTLTAGTTQTVGAFGLAGTAGNLITLNTTSAGVQATLSDSSGINSVSFVSIKDINATGGAVWNAYSSSGNIDAGNNTGWDFNDLLFRYIYTRRKNKVIFPI